MSATKFDNLSASLSKAKVGSTWIATAAQYYGQNTGDVDSVAWVGGELWFDTSVNRLYVQTATSGTAAAWKRLADTFATTTSTSTTSTTSTSTSTSSTTSTSTSTSSTTTMA